MTATAPDASPSMLDGYRPVAGRWDEMLTPGGDLREHWSTVGPAIAGLGVDQLFRRRHEAERLLDDDGVTYHVYGDVEGRSRRWELDPVPIVVPGDTWTGIEKGVVQRAELLDLVLADLYGRRELLQRGDLPPGLVFSHPGFLRPCDQVRVPGNRQLFVLATDLTRAPDGTTWVLGDRAQAPSGAGYALENRVVTSRVLPGVYRDAQVHRLAPFFRTLRSALQDAAPANAGDPRIVVLTPGSLAETAFEHAFLASYLGYPLVEGSDLVMREGRVWLRTLGRLEPVDVVLRRLDAGYCDPLELRVDSQLGVPGLVEACRLGTVSVVNPLGSGVLENPGLQRYLPAIAERLLGQELRLPCVPTWWCGDDRDRQHVLANLDTLVVKRTDQPGGASTVLPWTLAADARDDLRRTIEARPESWVGQELLSMGSTPTLTVGGLAPRRYVLRAFAVSTGDAYVVMPGGLTRVAPTDDEHALISNQAGAISKDTWVLASAAEPSGGYWLRGGPLVPALEPEASMPSRAAENLFWLGRYAERADAVTRLLRVVFDRRNEFAHGTNPAGTAALEALLRALTEVTTTGPGFLDDAILADPGDELASLMSDRDRPGTLAHAVAGMLDAAYAVRDQLSNDTWLVVADLDRDLVVGRPTSANHRATLGRVMRGLLALSGLASESMVRDPGWRFMEIGRRIERSLQLVRLLRACVGEERGRATDSLLLESVLVAAESIITYRRRYRSQAQPATVLDLLLLAPENPRSLSFQVQRLAEEVGVLPGSGSRGPVTEVGHEVVELRAALRAVDTSALAAVDDDRQREELVAFLDQVASRLTRAAEAINVAHFTHLLPQRSLAGWSPLHPSGTP